MKGNISPKTSTEKKRSNGTKAMDASESYQVEGRTFIVQPVFQESGEVTLAALLLNLLRADASPE